MQLWQAGTDSSALENSKANKTTVLYSFAAPCPPLPPSPAGIRPTGLAPRAIPHCQRKGTIFPSAPGHTQPSAVPALGRRICPAAETQHAALARPRARPHVHPYTGLLHNEVFSSMFFWGKPMGMAKVLSKRESVKRSCFALITSPHSLLKNQWVHL